MTDRAQKGLDRAMEEICKRRSVRTPILGAILDMEDAAVDALLAEPLARGALIGCDVEVGGAKVKEYRATVAFGGQGVLFTTTRPHREPDPVKARLAEWREPKPSIGQASADVAQPAPSRPAAPAPVDSPKEKPMPEKKTIAERCLDAFKKHGPCSVAQLAEHVDTTPATLYTMMGTLVKKHGVRKVEGQRGVYELTGLPVRESAKPQPFPFDSPYAGALADLRTKREAMARDLTKLDHAIEAIEALG